MNAQSSIIPFTFENTSTIRAEMIDGKPCPEAGHPYCRRFASHDLG